MKTTLTVVTEVGTFTKNTTRPYTHCAVLATETMYGEANTPGTQVFWSSSAAGALKLTNGFIGVNGFRLVGVFAATEAK